MLWFNCKHSYHLVSTLLRNFLHLSIAPLASPYHSKSLKSIFIVIGLKQWTLLVHLIQLDKKEEEFSWNPADIGWQSQQWVFLSSSSLPDFPGFSLFVFSRIEFYSWDQFYTFRLGPLLHTWCLLPGSIGGTRIVFALVSILTNHSFGLSTL